MACGGTRGWAAGPQAAGLSPALPSAPGSRGLAAAPRHPTLPWPVVWSYLGPRLSTRCQWASVRWPVCQPQAPRSKLQETSGGGQRRVSTPDTPPECREAGGDWLLERGLVGAPGGGLGGGPSTQEKHLSLPQWLLRGCSPSGSRRPPLRPAARGRPRPPARPTPASGGTREEAVSQGWPHGGPSPPQAALLTRNGRRRAPRRTLSTFQPPAVLPRACHTSSRRLPSTTTSSRKPGEGSLWAARPAPAPRPGAPTPHPRTGQRVRRDGGTLGVTLKIVNQAELAAGARGAEGGCEHPGLLGQLPPGPLHGQEVPWGEQASEPVPPRDPDPAPSLGRGGSWKAGLRPPRAEPHQQPCGHLGRAPLCPGPGGAPTAAAPRWRLPSPRRRVTRSPWCLQGQGAGVGLGLASHSQRRGRGKGGEAPGPLTTFLLVLAPRALLLEVTQLLRGHTQVPTEEVSGLAEAPRPQAGRLGPGAWGPAPRRGTGQLCGPARRSGGLAGAVLLLGWDGVGRGGTGWEGPAGSPGIGLQWSDRMRSSRPTTPPGPVCPAKRIWGQTGSGGAPAPRCDPQAGLPPNPLPRIHTSSLALAGHPALQRASLQGALPSSGLPSS